MARKVENWRRIAKLTFWIFTRFKSALSTYRYLSLPICDSYHWYSYHLPFLSLSFHLSALLINRFYQIIINRSKHTLWFFPIGFIRSYLWPLQENYLISPAPVYPSTTSRLLLSRPSSPVNRLMGGFQENDSIWNCCIERKSIVSRKVSPRLSSKYHESFYCRTIEHQGRYRR